MSKENKAENIKVFGLNAYIKPDVKETSSNDWVLNGKANSFYQYTIDRFNGSPTNAAVINSYVDLIYGKGLTNTNGNTEGWLQFKRMLSDGDVRRVVSDYKLFGEAIIQVIPANGKGNLPTCYHLPNELTAPQKRNEDNEIEGYFYCENWAKVSQNKPEFFPMFEDKDTREASCYSIKPYKAGKVYFSDPDYLAGMQYAELEEEISNYYISHIKNGLSFGYIINIPNGSSYTPEEKNEIERKIKQNLTGSSQAGKFVINFGEADAKVEVTAIEVNSAHKQWEFLTAEARQQIMTAHRVTSPMLFGIKDNTGLGNNADELDTAEAQLMKRVIEPSRRFLIDHFENIAAICGLSLRLKFKSLTDEVVTEDVVKTDISMTSDLTRTLESYALDAPVGFELCTDDITEVEMSAIQKSEQDSDLWKIRYAYAKGTSKTPDNDGREFCKSMMRLSNAGKVFRVEDINKMSDDGVNGQFAHSGGKYDIFLYAGGVNCHHRWERRIYKKKKNDNGDAMGGNAMQNTNYVNVSEAKRQGAKIPTNPKDVAIAEIDKPNKGKYPS